MFSTTGWLLPPGRLLFFRFLNTRISFPRFEGAHAPVASGVSVNLDGPGSESRLPLATLEGDLEFR